MLFTARLTAHRARALLTLSWLLVALSIALWPGSSVAQSAADKATARQQATEGIKLYQAGKYTEALDKLQRAQALYDAPVHLLYIARSQAQLGQLVEAAETYRQLSRVRLTPGAPKAFEDAIASGNKELEQLEPKVPSLRIEVKPANLPSLEVKVDGEKISTAALGVDRPTNPGKHIVSADAQGYDATEQTVELAVGEKKSIGIALQASATEAAAAPGEAGPPGEVPSAKSPDVVPEPEQESAIGFVAGIRLGGAIPFGTASSDEILAGSAALGSDLAMNEFFRGGGGFELHLGVQFLQRVTGLLFYEREELSPGSRLEDVSGYVGEVVVNSTTNAQNLGIGATVSFQSGKLGFFAELDFAFLHTYSGQQTVELVDPVCEEYENSLTYSGNALRLGGGMHIPIGNSFRISPVALVTVGSFSSFEAETGCDELNHAQRPLEARPFEVIAADETSAEIDLANSKTHGSLFIGIGGDFLFAGGKPLK